MTKLIIAYLSTASVFLIIDALWLGIVAKNFYAEQLGDLMANDIKFGIAAIFYLIYVIGIIIFAVNPALQNGSWTHAAIYGALFGFFAYATYDFTNMATIQDWPIKMSLVDLAWGTFITGTSATLGYFITNYFIAVSK